MTFSKVERYLSDDEVVNKHENDKRKLLSRLWLNMNPFLTPCNYNEIGSACFLCVSILMLFTPTAQSTPDNDDEEEKIFRMRLKIYEFQYLSKNRQFEPSCCWIKNNITLFSRKSGLLLCVTKEAQNERNGSNDDDEEKGWQRHKKRLEMGFFSNVNFLLFFYCFWWIYRILTFL